MRRLGMTAHWHRTYGPTTRQAVLTLVSLIMAFVLGYVLCTAFFDLVETWQHNHTPAAPTVTQTTNPVQMSELLVPADTPAPTIHCVPVMSWLGIDGCPIVVR